MPARWSTRSTSSRTSAPSRYASVVMEPFCSAGGSCEAGGPKSALSVTTSTTSWQGRYVVPTGEVRPGVRTPKVFWAQPAESRRGFGWLDYGVLALYLATLVAMGVYFSRRERSTHDFFLGGRRIPWWAAGLSIFGTQLSAITFMAIPAKTYATDWRYFMGNMAIIMVAPVIILVFLPFYRRLNVTTAYEYLERSGICPAFSLTKSSDRFNAL